MSARLREIRLVMPVVVCWCVLFAISIFSCAAGWNRRWDDARSWLDYGLIATSGVGIWMVVVWISLYREMRFGRLLMAPLLTAGFACLGFLAYSLVSGDDFRRDYLLIVIPTIPSLIGIVFLVLVRW